MEASDEMSGFEEYKEYGSEIEEDDDFDTLGTISIPRTTGIIGDFNEEQDEVIIQEREPEEQVFMEGYAGGQRLGGALEESLKIQTYLKRLREVFEISELSYDEYSPDVKKIKRYWKLNPETLAEALKIRIKLKKYNVKGDKEYKESLEKMLKKSASKGIMLDETNIFRYYKLLSK